MPEEPKKLSGRSGFVQTVLGLVEPSTLGHTQTHEHILKDGRGGLPVGGSIGTARYLHDAIRLDNYASIRRYPSSCLMNVSLDSEEDAIQALDLYRGSGGGCVVDASNEGFGQDPAGLARVSRRTGVHIVMGAGHYLRSYHAQPEAFDALSAEDIASTITDDIENGVGTTGVRAGIIGEIGLSWPVHPTELKSLVGAAMAQAHTGAPLQIHPGRDPQAPMRALEEVEKAGGNVSRTIMCHLDRTFSSPPQFLELAASGCYLELDLFGRQESWYRYQESFDLPNDAVRVRYLRELVDAGYGDRLLFSQDIAHKCRLQKYGGEGYHHILETVLPHMRSRGWSEPEIEAIRFTNPARALRFR